MELIRCLFVYSRHHMLILERKKISVHLSSPRSFNFFKLKQTFHWSLKMIAMAEKERERESWWLCSFSLCPVLLLLPTLTSLDDKKIQHNKQWNGSKRTGRKCLERDVRSAATCNDVIFGSNEQQIRNFWQECMMFGLFLLHFFEENENRFLSEVKFCWGTFAASILYICNVGRKFSRISFGCEQFLIYETFETFFVVCYLYAHSNGRDFHYISRCW